MEKAVFLDRDGVLNQAIVRDGKPYPPANLREVVILPGVLVALQKLKAADYILIVVTNQPDVSRGLVTQESVEEINYEICGSLPIDDVRTCYHDNKDECECRKPSPGSMLSAAAKFNVDLKASFMIGDRWRDIEAGQRAGCKTLFINYNYSEKQPVNPNYQVSSLSEAVDIILEVKL